MTKNYKLTSAEQIQAAREMEAVNKEFQRRFTILKNEFDKANLETLAEYRKRMRELFRIAAKDILPDPDDAFFKNSHFVNYAFLDHGDVYLCETNPEDDGITATDGETEITPPRKIVLN